MFRFVFNKKYCLTRYLLWNFQSLLDLSELVRLSIGRSALAREKNGGETAGGKGHWRRVSPEPLRPRGGRSGMGGVPPPMQGNFKIWGKKWWPFLHFWEKFISFSYFLNKCRKTHLWQKNSSGVGETRGTMDTFQPWILTCMPDNKVSFRNAHVRKFKQLSSYIAVKAEILVVFLKNEIKKKILGAPCTWPRVPWTGYRGTMDIVHLIDIGSVSL